MIEKDRKERFSEYVRKRRQLKRWHRATVLLAALALVVTVAFMVMPAVTLENGSGMLNCSLDLHEHTSGCYDTEGELTCGYADFVVHTHTADCYDDSGALICPLPEIAEHTHTDECYMEERVLVCALEETQPAAHEHTDGCYTVREGAQSVCGLTEGEGHVHTADCYAEAEPVLICEQAEGEEHTHTAECYAEAEPELICGLEESEPHEHTLDCYSEEDIVLSCEYAGPAEPGHTHTDECYEIQRVLTCGREEIVLHTHTADCWDESGALICGRLEVREHVHDESCFPAPEPTEEPLPTPETSSAPEPTPEATPEPTPEATPEPTPETTPEPTPETTPEPTPETTPEPTPEATPEPTPEPTVSIDPDATSWATVEKPGYDPDSAPLAANSFISLMNEQEGTDFGQYITDTTFEVQNGNVWEPVDGSVTDGANIRVTINYAIPEGIVTQNNRTIYYQLPKGIALEKDETGRVTIGNDEVGDYTITKGGLITITFDVDFANDDAFNGNIHFQGTVSLTETGGEQEITFGGDGGTITVVPEEKKYNLRISKVGAYVKDPTDYEALNMGIKIEQWHVIYTVEVRSDENSDGSDGTITVTDKFTHNPADGVVTYDKNNIAIFKINPNTVVGEGAVPITDYELVYTYQQTDKDDAQTSSFTITGLPALQPGEFYIINYSASIDFGTVNSPNGYIAVPNTATAQDKSNNVSANATVSVSGNMVSKLVTENEGTGNLQWTVTLNEDGRDLSGMTFSDTMLYRLDGIEVNYNLRDITNLRVTAAEINDAGQQVPKGDVTDAFSDLITYEAGVMTVNFPAAGDWPAGLGSDWVYRLVYETPFPEDAGADAAIAFQNTAKLDNYRVTVYWNGTVPDTGYGLVKENTGRDLNTGTDVGTIDWRSTITYPSDNVNLDSIQYMDWIPDAYYTNSGVFADGTHYTTLSTLRKTLTIQTALEQNLVWGTDFTVSVAYAQNMEDYSTFDDAWKDAVGIFDTTLTDVTGATESDEPIALFCINFTDAALGKLAGSRQLYISYQTLVNRNNITDGGQLTISNVGVIQGNTVRAWLRTAFHEQLQKQVSSTGTAPSGDDYNLDSDVYVDGQVDIDLGDTGGKLYYRILFYNYGDTISFHDDMLQQFDGNIAFEQQMRIYDVLTGKVRTVKTWDYLNSSEKYHGNYTLNNLGQFKECIIGLYYSIDVSGDEALAALEEGETHTYNNTIEWTGVGEDSAAANVTNSDSTLTKDSVQATEDVVNLVYYYVVINPASRDLHPASNQLELRDTLTLPTGAEAVIRLETIGLYHYDAAKVDGHYLGEEITEEEFDGFKVEAEPGTENTYTFTVPDEMACVVVYAYEIDSGTSALDEITVNNTASLLGRAVISAGDEVIISAQDSGGTVNRATLTIYKYAGDNRANLLDGVLFELARYEEQGNGNYAWVQTSITAAGRDGYFITGGDKVTGAIILNFLDERDGGGTHYNTLYRLTEYETLVGYELDTTPRYYVWGELGATEEATAEAMADALKGADVAWDQIVFIPFGESKTEYISNAPTTTSIKVEKIWQDIDGNTLTENLPESVTVTLYCNGVKYEGEGAEVTLSAENNWSHTWENLPKEDENNPYTYTVVETPVDGFETSYGNNDGITDGTITVINKETAVYVLPETGGTGAWRILALALVTLSLGTLCVLQIRRARRSRH